MAENQESRNVFEHYLELSLKSREMIVDEMEPDDRCRFRRCSKLSNKEAKASKKYFYNMELLCGSDFSMIAVQHGEHSHGFGLWFTTENDKKMTRYRNLAFPHPAIETELDEKANLTLCAFEDFKRIFGFHQESIRSLYIGEHGTEMLKNVDLGVESLDKLEDLKLNCSIDIRKVFSKLRNPLKSLVVSGKVNCARLDFEKIRQIPERVELREVSFDTTQFLQLSAKSVSIPLGKMNEKDIFKFIRSWQDGTIGKEIGTHYWYQLSHNFNETNFLRLLRVDESDFVNRTIEIKHFNKPGKSAWLFYNYIGIKLFL